MQYDDANPDLDRPGNLPKSRNNRKRSKARGIIDDDEDELADGDNNNDVALDVTKMMDENDGTVYGSDDQNYNQNNIEIDQGLELKLNRDAFFDVEEKDQEKGKKSVEIADMKHFTDLNNG
jgi:hypothetical protein